MAEYRSRESDVTAIDTKTELTTLGSQATPGALQVPQGVSRIAQIIATIGVLRITATTAAGAVIFLRIEGDAVSTSQSIMVAGAGGFTTTSGSEVFSQGAVIIPTDIPVVPGNTINIFAEMAGADLGTVTVGATLVFTK